jgi:L-asparaginase
MNAHILIVYAGGTIGMWEDPETGTLIPLNLNELTKFLPELKGLQVSWEGISLKRPIDSSELTPDVWYEIVDIISANYNSYDGFVLMHGTDTMAYTSSALSFMLEGLRKPVIVTGSQLPLGRLRTDGKENFITAIEIAAMRNESGPIVQEVAICFGNKLMRGNRAWKSNTEIFDAIESPNYPALANIGTHIVFNYPLLLRSERPFLVNKHMTEGVGVIKLYPGILPSTLDYALSRPDLRVCIVESYGAGNVPNIPSFLRAFEQAIARGVSIINLSQCRKGSVDSSLYKTGKTFADLGVIFGNDLTFEAAITKSMFLLGKNLSQEEFRIELLRNYAGEVSVSQS